MLVVSGCTLVGDFGEDRVSMSNGASGAGASTGASASTASAVASTTVTGGDVVTSTGVAGSGDGGAGGDGGASTSTGGESSTGGSTSEGGGGTGGEAPTRRWPDSEHVFCTDGLIQVDPCPEEGDPTYGQDGNYDGPRPGFETSPEVAVDEVTGLEWSRIEIDTNRAWEGARQQCENVHTAGGHDDWRLPTLRELASLLDTGAAADDVALDPMAFPDAQLGYWVGELLPGTSNHLAIRTDLGLVHIEIFAANATYQRWGRCIRGEPLRADYVDDSADLVTDRSTGLTWQRVADPTARTWVDALAYCEGLALEGGGFRVPSLKEQLTIVDLSRAERIDTTHFSSSDAMPSFWTSTPVVATEDEIITYDFGTRLTENEAPTTSRHVRCVR